MERSTVGLQRYIFLQISRINFGEKNTNAHNSQPSGHPMFAKVHRTTWTSRFFEVPSSPSDTETQNRIRIHQRPELFPWKHEFICIFVYNLSKWNIGNHESIRNPFNILDNLSVIYPNCFQNVGLIMLGVPKLKNEIQIMTKFWQDKMTCTNPEIGDGPPKHCLSIRNKEKQFLFQPLFFQPHFCGGPCKPSTLTAVFRRCFCSHRCRNFCKGAWNALRESRWLNCCHFSTCNVNWKW